MSVMLDVVSGDITTRRADAIITAINSGGMWFGGVDNAIQRVSGSLFHAQAANQELHDGDVVVATGGPAGEGQFANVVFIIDDLVQPLADLVYTALMEADKAGVKTVNLPTLRTGVMAGVVEPTVGLALEALAQGILRFTPRATSITDITIVVYGDPDSELTLKGLLFGAEPGTT